MITKYAKVEEILEIKTADQRFAFNPDFAPGDTLNKFASLSSSDSEDGYLYVRCRAISSRVNKNNDGWPSAELAKAYKTFIGRPIFVDHNNDDPSRARGVIVDSRLHVEDDEKTSSFDPYYASAPENHKPPTWIELLLEVDAKTFPKLANAVRKGHIDAVSMGANIETSVCSVCSHSAKSPLEYCSHVSSKGADFEITADNGEKMIKKAYEDCHDINFFEISFVFDPADPTALISEQSDSKLSRVAKGKCECWDGYERVPGTEPCAPGSCKKCDERIHNKKSSFQAIADTFDAPAYLRESVIDLIPSSPGLMDRFIEFFELGATMGNMVKQDSELLNLFIQNSDPYKIFNFLKSIGFLDDVLNAQEQERILNALEEQGVVERNPVNEDEFVDRRVNPEEWNREQLEKAGFTPDQIEAIVNGNYPKLINGDMIDVRTLLNVVEQGATPDQALRIYTKIAAATAPSVGGDDASFQRKAQLKELLNQMGFLSSEGLSGVDSYPDELVTAMLNALVKKAAASTYKDAASVNQEIGEVQVMQIDLNDNEYERTLNHIPQGDLPGSPADVETLKDDVQCPNCKSDHLQPDSLGTLKCPSCSWVQPPFPMDNPDLLQHREIAVIDPENNKEEPKLEFFDLDGTINKNKSSKVINRMNWKVVSNKLVYSATLPSKKVLNPTMATRSEDPKNVKVVSDQKAPVMSSQQKENKMENKESKLLVAFSLADEFTELGLIPADEKLAFVAELENESEDALKARQATISLVKKAGLARPVAKVAGLSRVPKFSSFNTEAASQNTDDVPFEAIFM